MIDLPGKTLTLMGIAAVCRLLGIDVIYTTQTHFTGNAACETADKFVQLSHIPLDVLRFTQMGPMPQSAIKDENFVPMDVSSESQMLMSRFISNMRENHFTKSYGVPSKSLESHGKEHHLTAVSPQARRVRLFVHHPAVFLHILWVIVIRLAIKAERQLISSYPSEEQIAQSKGDLYDMIVWTKARVADNPLVGQLKTLA
ncbi:hypothetical protein FE257_007450 [Aspergillus nanangensis]|uniref:Uncharacterized protein n=1 Tax=Aspergillus nanangensis TaxID=2582783 RepID=A0AAD4CMN4_ASPNN|nr:hypothetical protein FE257_007450 [Aspergillus nanangensis]